MIETLNRDCFCVSLDPDALRRSIEADPAAQGLYRLIGPDSSMKSDVRNYVYDGQVQLLAARIYQGQTTNFRTAGGGFALVLTTPAVAAERPSPPACGERQRVAVAGCEAA